jgi:hypothetical protein
VQNLKAKLRVDGKAVAAATVPQHKKRKAEHQLLKDDLQFFYQRETIYQF